jgi:hypothetical protein
VSGHAIRALLLAAALVGCSGEESAPGAVGEPTPEALDGFARCLTARGWVMYSSSICSACRAQRKAFGGAFEHIEEIECNPHAPQSQAERCLEREVRRTPTWLREIDGEVAARLEDYQLLDALAVASDCPL